MRWAERGGETVGTARDEEKVDVVRHQAPGPDRGPGLRAAVPQKGDIAGVIGVGEEGRLAPRAALGDVVRDTWQDQTDGARHRAKLAEKRELRRAKFPKTMQLAVPNEPCQARAWHQGKQARAWHQGKQAFPTTPGWRVRSMAKLVFGMNQSLDGYVDHMEFAPDPALFRHWIEQVRGVAGSVYGRRMYEIMRYWDEDSPEWGAEQRAFAAAWRSQKKWVVSRSLESVGPNAALVGDDFEATIRGLKARLVGEIAVSGPELARSLTDLGLIDEYRLYFHPVVLGRGKPFFAGPRPPLRLVASDRIGEDVIRLTYVPA